MRALPKEYPYRVISCSENRSIHESKKAWLGTQGIHFGDYAIRDLPKDYTGTKYWGGLNFYWCFADEETATMFRLRWNKE